MSNANEDRVTRTGRIGHCGIVATTESSRSVALRCCLRTPVSSPLTDNEPMSLKRTLAAVAFTVAAFGQTPSSAPSNVVPYGMSISPDAAKKVAAAAIAEAHKNNWEMAVAVVDPAGYLVYFERMQDTQLGSVEVAIDKAKSAALFRRPTKAFQDIVAGGGEGLRMLKLTGAIPVEGGIPLVAGGKIIGAVGASGGSSDQDGRTAQAGAAAMK
jgi:glc operon protein GlcG